MSFYDKEDLKVKFVADKSILHIKSIHEFTGNNYNIYKDHDYLELFNNLFNSLQELIIKDKVSYIKFICKILVIKL